MGSTVLVSLANAVPFADGRVVRYTALYFSLLGGSLSCCLQQWKTRFLMHHHSVLVLRATTFIDLEALWREAIPRLYSGSARTCSDAVYSRLGPSSFLHVTLGVYLENFDLYA